MRKILISKSYILLKSGSLEFFVGRKILQNAEGCNGRSRTDER